MNITYGNCDETEFAHINEGKDNLVIFQAVKVLLYEENGAWFAQGLEVDHFAQGKTEDEAKLNFGKSLGWTIEEHLRTYKHLNNLLKLAPQEAWNDYFSSQHTKSQKYSCYRTMQITGDTQALFPQEMNRLKYLAFEKKELATV